MTTANRVPSFNADTGVIEATFRAAINTLIAAGIVSKADAAALTAHLADQSNPHATTKAQIGLALADNTSDVNKPVSTAVQAAIDTINAALATKVNSSTYTTGLAGKADLVSGKIPTSQIPAISTHETVSVANRAAMLALTTTAVQVGDVAVIGSTGAAGDRGLWLLTATDPSVIGNWTHLDLPVGAVASINGQTGVVNLAAADVGAATTASVAGKADLAITTIDLVDATVAGTTGQLALGVTSNVAAGGAYTSPNLPGALGTPPARFAVKAAAGGPCTITFPDSTGTPSTVTVLAGEILTLRQKNTTGWGAESGNKPLGQLDARFAASAQVEAPDAVPLKRFRQALANIDTAPLNWLAIGDSLTEGSGATSIENSWVNRVRRALQRDWTFAGKGGSGFVNTYVKGSPDLNGNVGTPTPKAYWTFTGGTAGVGGTGQPGGLLGTRMRIMGVNETATLTFVGTGVDLHYTQGVTTAKPFTYSVDGAAAVTVTPSTTGGTNRQGRNTVIRGLASGTHTVAIVPSSSSDASPLLGATVYDGDEANGLRLLNDGTFGITSTAVAATTGPGGSTYLTDIMALWPNPALVTIYLSTNDPVNTVDPATTITNLQTIIANVKAKCTIAPSFLLVVPSERASLGAGVWATYIAAVRSVAAADPTNVALLDLSLRIPDVPVVGNNYNQGLNKSDGVHFLDAGYLLQAQLILRRLLGDMVRAA